MNNTINQNFLSTDQKTARNSHNQYFSVGETVGHDSGKEAGEAEILSFEFDVPSNEVLTKTSKGSAHLDFLIKL
jgi:hypothetical protein